MRKGSSGKAGLDFKQGNQQKPMTQLREGSFPDYVDEATYEQAYSRLLTEEPKNELSKFFRKEIIRTVGGCFGHKEEEVLAKRRSQDVPEELGVQREDEDENKSVKEVFFFGEGLEAERDVFQPEQLDMNKHATINFKNIDSSFGENKSQPETPFTDAPSFTVKNSSKRSSRSSSSSRSGNVSNDKGLMMKRMSLFSQQINNSVGNR